MAKKSAASKGYRKVKKAKPFLTVKEIIILAVIIAAIVLGFILINAIPKLGTIPARKVQSTDIVSRANIEAKNRYKVVGTINKLEGYTHESSTSPDSPVGEHTFTPEDEGSSLSALRVRGAIWDAAAMSETVLASVKELTPDEVTETPIEATINGSTAYIFTTRDGVTEESEDADAEAASYEQNIYCYINAAGEYSISMTANLRGEDTSFYIPDDQLVEYMNQFAGVFNIAAE